MTEPRFEWGPANNRANILKHRVSFEQALRVFSDPLRSNKFDGFDGGEERWRTYGEVVGLALIMVAHTYRDDEGAEVIRIISARQATRNERRSYEREDG